MNISIKNQTNLILRYSLYIMRMALNNNEICLVTSKI